MVPSVAGGGEVYSPLLTIRTASSPPRVLDEARHIFISGADIGERQVSLLRRISYRAASRVIFRFASASPS